MTLKHLYATITCVLLLTAAVMAQPANDECANATLLPLGVNACTTILNGTTQNATASNPALPDCSGANGQDVWYKFIPQTSGYVSLRITNTINIYALYTVIYSGTCGNLVNEYCTNEGVNYLQFKVTQGTTYYIKVSDIETPEYYDFTICGFMTQNDNCTNPPVISVGPGYCSAYTFGTTENATQSNNAPVPTCGAANGYNDDVWYRFTATAAGNLLISTLNQNSANSDISEQVYQGNCGALQAVSCNSTTNYAANYIMVNAPAAGTEYYLRIFSSGSAPADYCDFYFCVQTLVAPANNDCANAVYLNVPENTCQGITYFTTLGATASANVPTPACNAAGTDDDVWITFQAPRTGTIRLNLETFSYNNNTAGLVLQAYTGTCSNLAAIPGLCNTYSSSGFLDIQTTAGTTYYIRAFTQEASAINFANFTLCAFYPPPVPSNNDCAGAAAVTVSSSSTCANAVSSTTFGATQSLPGCDGTADDDVWFRFTATAADQTIKVVPTATNGLTDVVFQVFSGNCSAPVSIQCINQTTGTNAEEAMLTGFTPGNTYYVRVYSQAADVSATGNFVICIAGAALPAPDLLANNSFENPVQTGLGSHALTSIPSWTISGQQSYLILTDGVTNYNFGPDMAHHGTQYLSVEPFSPYNYISQNFSLPNPASIHFGIWFSKQAATSVNDFDGFVEILDANTVARVATSFPISFTAGESQEIWKQTAGDVSLPAGDYIFRFRINNNLNYDDAFITINDPTVAAVSIVASHTSICPNANVMFTALPVNGGTTPIYQWQKNGINVWIDTTVYNDNTLIVTDIITCKLTSNNPVVISPMVTSNPISVAINSGCYCIPPYNPNTGLYTISNVVLNGLANQTTNSPYDGYNDFTNIVFSGRQAELATFSIATSYLFAYTRIWIDFNDDLDFDDAGELVFYQKRNGLDTINGHFYLSVNVPAGNHRIRFRSNANTVFTACEAGNSGETEDYTINIAPGNNCSGNPVVAYNMASQYVICNGDNTELTAYANGLNISYQWQSAPAGTNNFNAVVNNGPAPNIYTTAALTAATDFRCKITCNNSQFIYSQLQRITIGTPPPNDLICNAISLIQGVWDTQNTTCATVTGENFSDSAVCSSPNNTVWYKVTPAVTERLRLQINKVANDPYPIDAWINIFKLSSNCQNPVLTAVSPYPFNCLRANLNNDSSVLVQAGTYLDFPPCATGILQADSTYYIRIDGYIGSFGAYNITSLTPTAGVPATNIWLGTVDIAWENPANWSGGVLPGPNTDVIINSNMVRYPSINSNVTIRSLRLNPGAAVITKTGYQLKVTH